MDLRILLKVLLTLFGILVLILIAILSIAFSLREDWCGETLYAGDCELYLQDNTCYCIDKVKGSNIDFYNHSQTSCQKLSGFLAMPNNTQTLKWLAKRLYYKGADYGLIGLRKFGNKWYWMDQNGPVVADDIQWRNDVLQNRSHSHASINVQSIIIENDTLDHDYIVYNYDHYIDHDTSYEWYGIATIDIYDTADQGNGKHYICHYTNASKIEDDQKSYEDAATIMETNKVLPGIVEFQTPAAPILTVNAQDPCECNQYEQISLVELEDSKTIISPGYPDGYCDNQNCGWLIETQGELGIRLQWIAFNTEKQMDFVSVYSAHSRDYSKLCTGTKCTDQTSSGQFMYVHFTSDHVTQDIGFKARVTAVHMDVCYCSEMELINLSSMEESYTINFQFGDCSNLDCKWSINGTEGYGLQLSWNKFNLGPLSIVSVYDGDMLKQGCSELDCDDLITESARIDVHLASKHQNHSNAAISAVAKIVQNFCEKNDLSISSESISFSKQIKDGHVGVGGTATLTCDHNHKIIDTIEDTNDSVICISPHWSRQLTECIPVCELPHVPVGTSRIVHICYFGNKPATSMVPLEDTISIEQHNFTNKKQLATKEYTCTEQGWSPETPTCTKMSKVIFLIGGQNHPTELTKPSIYIPGINSTELNMVFSRRMHGSVLLPNGDVLIAGGEDSNLSTCLINLNMGELKCEPGPVLPRFSAAIAQLNGLAYICGGATITGLSMTHCDVYGTNGWTTMKAAPLTLYARIKASMVALNNSLYLMGGYQEHVSPWTIENMVERYSLETDEWQVVASMHHRRLSSAATVLNGLIYNCGGVEDTITRECLFSCESFDPNAGMWWLIAPMNHARRYFGLVGFEGKLVALGGYTMTTYSFETLRSVESYDPVEDKWKLEQLELHLPMQEFTAVVVSVAEGFQLLY